MAKKSKVWNPSNDIEEIRKAIVYCTIEGARISNIKRCTEFGIPGNFWQCQVQDDKGPPEILVYEKTEDGLRYAGEIIDGISVVYAPELVSKIRKDLERN